MLTAIRRAGTWSSFVKLEHTLFSLPVLFGGAWLAARGLPSIPTLLWIGVAGTGARTLAMALNRIADRHIDARNPRTAARELPAGKMTLTEAWGVAAAGAAVYLIACLQLPPVCLYLSPLPVAVFALYPFMKRFTPLAHLGVGAALALAPLGAWAAVRGDLQAPQPALLLALFTLCWVAGFDIIYATLDEEFDRAAGLHSLPRALGARRALWASWLLHTVAVAAMVVLYARYLDGTVSLLALLALVMVLVAEQRLASRVHLAFFQLNLAVGFLAFAVVLFGVAGV